jgi:TetR/AcrR family transcriptional regulator, transcriptional repressor of aconitase
MVKKLNQPSLPENQTIFDDRQKILTYAQERFFRDGFNKISMDEIARELQMSKSTLYKHFPSKVELVRETMFMLVAGVKGKIGAVISSDANAVEKFVAIAKALTETITRFSDKWMNDMQHHAPALWAEVDEIRRRLMYRNISKIIQQGQKEELIHKYPPEIIITTFTGAMRAVVNPHFLTNIGYSYNDAVHYAFKILLNGMLTDKGKNILNHLKIFQ